MHITCSNQPIVLNMKPWSAYLSCSLLTHLSQLSMVCLWPPNQNMKLWFEVGLQTLACANDSFLLRLLSWRNPGLFWCPSPDRMCGKSG